MKTINAVLLLVATTAPMLGYAESTTAPTLKPGDTWTYVDTIETAPNGWHQTHDEIAVVRTTADHIYFEEKPAGATQAAREILAGADWSRWRNVNGTDTMVNQPLSFPLSVGKTWEVKYTEAHPNVKHDSESFDTHFKVVGPESIEVPAGKFQAIKIEAEGEWTAQTAASRSAGSGTVSNQTGTTVVVQTRNATPVTATGRLYKAVWYVPEIGRWVKAVEEYYGSNGERSQRISSELESFKRISQ
ncbi:hypothetical protein N0A02_30835 [Paraburkholderia acidicola]|uniref:START domain-containing protein n=1 Tax=Paraburkholderia acidicola TaxID=1912599 RepID=A0ABV1LX02_9BURK